MGLRRGELVTLYVLVAVASALSGESVGQQLVRVISAPFWLATPENDWAALFHPHLPRGLLMENRRALQAFYEGNVSHTGTLLFLWFRVLTPWLVLTFFLLVAMTSLNLLVRKRWTESERLTYPVIQLPLLAIEEKAFLRNGQMWIGFGIGAGVTLLNGLHFLYPFMPGIRHIQDVSSLFISKPWDAMRPMVIAFYPSAIGMAYFMPLDLSFSTWFFFLVWKGELVLGSVLGWRSLPEFPYARWQQTGAYLAVGCLALWGCRHVLQRAGTPTPPASSEPMSYRGMVTGGIIGWVGVLVFASRMGFAVWIGMLVFGLYFVLSLAVTRMRAELGPLVHELYHSNADEIVTAVFGTRRISPRSLAATTTLWWLLRSQNSHVMPHQLEGFRLAERSGVEMKQLSLATLIAAIGGLAFTSTTVLFLGMRHGTDAGFALETYERLQRWLTDPKPTNVPATAFMLLGFGVVLLLTWMRRRFLWWSLHPIGYAVTQGDWAITYIWFSIFLSWLLKGILLRYGGVRVHRRASWVFLGLVLGDFVMGATWGLFGLVTGMRVYQFKNW